MADPRTGSASPTGLSRGAHALCARATTLQDSFGTRKRLVHGSRVSRTADNPRGPPQVPLVVLRWYTARRNMVLAALETGLTEQIEREAVLPPSPSPPTPASVGPAHAEPRARRASPRSRRSRRGRWPGRSRRTATTPMAPPRSPSPCRSCARAREREERRGPRADDAYLCR
jgi:hypothetical protein